MTRTIPTEEAAVEKVVEIQAVTVLGGVVLAVVLATVPAKILRTVVLKVTEQIVTSIPMI